MSCGQQSVHSCVQGIAVKCGVNLLRRSVERTAALASRSVVQYHVTVARRRRYQSVVETKHHRRHRGFVCLHVKCFTAKPMSPSITQPMNTTSADLHISLSAFIATSLCQVTVLSSVERTCTTPASLMSGHD